MSTELRSPRPGRTTVLRDTWTSFKRWNLKAVRNPFVLSFSLVQPIVWLVLFTQVFKAISQIPGFVSGSYLDFFAPAVVIQMALFASTSSGIGLVEDMRIGVFNKLLASPMNRTAIFLGKTLSETLRISLQVVLVVALALLLGAHVATGALGVVGIVVVAILFSLGFVALSNIVGLWTRSTEATIIGVNFLSLPLLFMSTAFLPLSLLPDWVQTVSAFNPITYGVDATRTLMLDGWQWHTLGKAVLVLVVIDLLLGSIAAIQLRRATDSKPR